ncbi:MAG: hypothetical protein ACKPEA_00970, partial [Planctomycetota bacterium]
MIAVAAKAGAYNIASSSCATLNTSSSERDDCAATENIPSCGHIHHNNTASTPRYAPASTTVTGDRSVNFTSRARIGLLNI